MAKYRSLLMGSTAPAVPIAADEVVRILSEQDGPMSMHDLSRECWMRVEDLRKILMLEEGHRVERVPGRYFNDEDIPWRLRT